MTLVPPSPDESQRVPPAPTTAYAVPSPPTSGSAWTGPPGSPTSARAQARSRPSWVAWTALGLSALTFLMATSIGILYAVDRLSSADPVSSSAQSGQGDGGDGDAGDAPYDAGYPAWGQAELTDGGAIGADALATSVEQAIIDTFENGLVVNDLTCSPIAAARKDVISTCSGEIEDIEAFVVVYLIDDDGSFVATVY